MLQNDMSGQLRIKAQPDVSQNDFYLCLILFGLCQVHLFVIINSFQYSMIQSMVDYVLERGNQHHGQFSHRDAADPNAALFNHRKLLEYLFQDNETSSFRLQNQKRISDMKYEQISGQLNYFSEKLHAELIKKHLAIDDDLYKLENEWLRKKMPDFYSYYFLKFAYANTYSRMHELFISEMEHMARQKDSYIVIKKTIQAREVCIANLRRQIASVTALDIEESLQNLREERALKKKKAIQNQQKGYKKKNKKGDEQQEVGKSWKNKIEIVFQLISHLRKLTAYVVELIKNWRNSIYGISEDPRRFRERVIFFHNDANYLLKTIFDNRFVFDSFLKQFLTFGAHYDPFFLKPCMVLQNKTKRTQDDEIFLSLIKPTEIQMDKMTKALVLLAEQQYDQDEQSRFLNERKNHGELEHRKKFIERRRDLVSKSQTNLNNIKYKQDAQKNKQGKQPDVKFANDKKSDNTQRQIEEVKMEKDEQLSKSRIQETLNRVKKIRSIDLKKVSPYLSRNQRIAKAQKVIELEHKFRVAQNQYVQNIKKQKEQTTRKEQMKKQWDSSQKQIINNRIFNKYIEENLKLMEEANKKAYVYKNKVSPKKGQAVVENMDYNKISFRDRKEAEYQRNLETYQRNQRTLSQIKPRVMEGSSSQKNFRSKGTRPIIQISQKGIRSNQNIVDFELTGKKGKNVNSILENAKKAQEMRLLELKLNPMVKQQRKKLEKQQRQKDQQELSKSRNLYEQEQKPEIIIMRQQPEKIQEIKQFLYAKIKEELLSEMKKSAEDKQVQLNNMIEEQKRRKLEEIMEQRRLEEIRKKQQEERMRLAQLQKQRKKIDFDIKVQPIQYSEQNVNVYFQKIFDISPQTYHRMFLNQKIEQKKQYLLDQFYIMFLRGFLDDREVAHAIVRYDWTSESARKLVIQYAVVYQFYHFISSFHQFCEYLWQNDPVQIIEIVVFKNAENLEGSKVIEDLQQYANRRGQTFERPLYSNMTELKYVWARPKQYQNIEFPFKKYYFGKLFNLKSELLSSSLSFNQRFTPKIDMNLEVFTSYVFLLEELFRKYLTPEEVIELRQNSTNIRRLKDIFRIVIELEKANPAVNQLTVIEGLNLDDLYQKMKQKTKPPYDKYYWHHFYDKALANRILLSILQFKLDLQFPINSCFLDDRRFLRINPRRKVLVLRSSVYSREPIYVLNTNNSKIRMFLMDAQNYKLMRIELFVFLNLVFNNVVEDTEKFVNSFWFPQFVVNSEHGKEVKRITDFSISMKKSFFLSEEIYYANHEYVKNAISFLPKKSDVIYRQALIVGFLHTEVEAGSTGMPIYAKMIDKPEMFNKKS